MDIVRGVERLEGLPGLSQNWIRESQAFNSSLIDLRLEHSNNRSCEPPEGFQPPELSFSTKPMMGAKIESTTPPTMSPMKLIKSGSIRLVNALTMALT